MDLLIVESAAKAKTLQKYLGAGWKVLATGGHVQTLPEDRGVSGKEATKAYWSNRPGALPEPPWVWTERGEKAFSAIVGASEPNSQIFLAADPDREGEFIAWSLHRLLVAQGRTRIHRVTFQEITRDAVQHAVANPRPIDLDLVNAALIRKFLDRLVGFRASKIAQSVLGGKASMGRVQTPTLGFVVERELEREAHRPIPYFELRVAAAGVDLQARFHEPDDADAWRDDAGKAVPTRTFDREAASRGLAALLAHGAVTLRDVSEGTRAANPKPAFSTDALLQAAGSRFGWSPKKTSALASALYEAGHVTYIRTDSTRLADAAVQAAREAVVATWGEDHLGPGARSKGTAGPVQDAHEAIRPTDLLRADVDLDDTDARRLYRLIRAQTLASQMAPSSRTILSVVATVPGFDRPLTGAITWRTFAGFEAAFAEFSDAPASGPPAIPVHPGASWSIDAGTDDAPNPVLIDDATRPPPRYRAHTLIKAMKDAGIGRPSTYASTVEKLEDKRFIEIQDGALAPTAWGRGAWLDVAPLYVAEATEAELFSATFTAAMEDRLDDVASGDAPASATWESWRDEFRALHEVARERMQRGRITPKLRGKLERLLALAPADVERPADLDALSWSEARALEERLRAAGVEPGPSELQRQYLARLLEDLGLPEEERVAVFGVADPTSLPTAARVSAAIEEARRLVDERRPPTGKQRALIARLLTKAGLDEAAGARAVGLEDLSGLTGGRDGTASALIDHLIGVTGGKRKGRG